MSSISERRVLELIQDAVRANLGGGVASSVMPAPAAGGVATVTYRPDRAKEDKTGPVAKYENGIVKILNQKSGRHVRNDSPTAKQVVAALSPAHRVLYEEAVRYLTGGAEALAKPVDPARSLSRRSRSQSRSREESSSDYIKPYGRVSEASFSTAFRQNPAAVIDAVEAAGHHSFANKLRDIVPYLVLKGEKQDNAALIRVQNSRAKNTYVERPVDVGAPSHLKALWDGSDPEIVSKQAYKADKDAAKNSAAEKGYHPHTAVPGAELRRAVVFGSPTSVKHAAADPDSERWQIAAWLAIHQGTGYEASAIEAAEDFRHRVASERRSRPAASATASATVRSRSPTRTTVPTERPTVVRRGVGSPTRLGTGPTGRGLGTGRGTGRVTLSPRSPAQ